MQEDTGSFVDRDIALVKHRQIYESYWLILTKLAAYTLLCKNMDNIASIGSVNNLAISAEVRRSQQSTFNNASNATDQTSDRAERRLRWENTPGISVSLQSLEQQPQLNEYQQLRADGRRKESTMAAAPIEHTEHIIEADRADKENSRSVNPRSKVILDSFIQQMGGAEQSMSSGSYVNTSV